MMENNFEKSMEEIRTPNTDFVKHQEVLKIGMISAKKSARIGIVFILFPMILVILAYVKIKLLIHFDFFAKLQQFVSDQNQSSVLSWVSPAVLIGLPILAIVINLLAITHFYVHKQSKELIITIRYRFKNLIVLLISAVVLIMVFMYVILLGKG
jgi:hypothetical protein